MELFLCVIAHFWHVYPNTRGDEHKIWLGLNTSFAVRPPAYPSDFCVSNWHGSGLHDSIRRLFASISSFVACALSFCFSFSPLHFFAAGQFDDFSSHS
jgi:hypothetical protein